MEHFASSGHPAAPAGGFFRSLADQDQFNRIAVQARGLAYLLGHAPHEIDSPVPERIRNAAWGLEHLLDRMHGMLCEVLFIPGEDSERFETLAAQAAGVAYLLGHCTDFEADGRERVASAAWAVQDMIDSMIALVSQREAGHE